MDLGGLGDGNDIPNCDGSGGATGLSLWRILWGLLGVAGLALRFLTSADLLQGIGIALVLFAGVGLLVDGFAERRTHPYTSALHALG